MFSFWTIAAFVLVVIGCVQLFRYKVFTRRQLEPHDVYPEILEWKPGDHLRLKGTDGTSAYYVSCDKDGTVYFSYERYLSVDGSDLDSNDIRYIRAFVVNESLQTRRLKEGVTASVPYMQLVQQVQYQRQMLLQAYTESNEDELEKAFDDLTKKNRK